MEKREYRLAGKTWPEGGEGGKHREECEFQLAGKAWSGDEIGELMEKREYRLVGKVDYESERDEEGNRGRTRSFSLQVKSTTCRGK